MTPAPYLRTTLLATKDLTPSPRLKRSSLPTAQHTITLSDPHKCRSECGPTTLDHATISIASDALRTFSLLSDDLWDAG